LYVSLSGASITWIIIRKRFSQPALPRKLSRPSAVNTVPNVIGTTSMVVTARLPGNRPLIQYANGTAANVLNNVAGIAKRRVSQIVLL
jgi:hypothetical protein